MRKHLTRFFVWVLVLTGGPILGAKLFDLLVLVGAWSRSPPASLHLLPYGPEFPVDTGEFFIPLSGAYLFASLAALASAWTTPLRYRALLVVAAIGILANLVLTVTVFWPLNSALWAYASHSPKATQSVDEIVQMVRTWVRLDWVRVAVGALGFLCVTWALSIPYPEERAPADPPAVRIALIIGLIGVAAFLVYFVSHV